MRQIELATVVPVGMDGRWSAGVRFESGENGMDVSITHSVSSQPVSVDVVDIAGLHRSGEPHCVALARQRTEREVALQICWGDSLSDVSQLIVLWATAPLGLGAPTSFRDWILTFLPQPHKIHNYGRCTSLIARPQID
jgi:hypothetical protein